MNKPIIILGNGGHASVLTEILLSQNRKIIGFTAPDMEENQFQIPYLGNDETILQYDSNKVELVLGIGSISVSNHRRRLFELFTNKQYTFANVIHPSAIIAPSVKLGQGVQIMAGAIIQTNSFVADNTIVNTGAKIDHDCGIGAHVHLAPGTTLSGEVKIGEGTHVGTGATIIQGITIGNHCLIGAGAVVIHNIKHGVKAVGVPAKEV
ncbi:acetyltransferase [Ureibacillus thermosphaericus]|uniref:UDP-perosamine 4-acetyltransferase n=1 Tax=Ureibacillus thermosphaericus TaxID=51173 RepID=A0A840PYJ9_URETH|nr:acetyltransferase [Ureibacillus thermosphaericus]MBB5149732.1 UDP-perosamine 4-acetyltransferase [Ureibacillus thermosphaericus]NKZ32635.1 acetyltransferase [Ureibacillus thermosphaericus]